MSIKSAFARESGVLSGVNCLTRTCLPFSRRAAWRCLLAATVCAVLVIGGLALDPQQKTRIDGTPRMVCGPRSAACPLSLLDGNHLARKPELQVAGSVKLFIAITSAYQNTKLRQAVRKTWLNYWTLWGGQITHRFFFGETDNATLRGMLDVESRTYNDVVVLPFFDSYRNLSRKTMWLSRWAVDNYNFTYLLKIDDDTFLRLDRYVVKLQAKPTQRFYYGNADPYYLPERGGKQGVTEEEYPTSWGRGPPWQHGFIYTMSHDCVNWIAAALPEPKIYLEDINTALILAEHNLSTPSMVGIRSSGCTEDMVATHYASIECMHHWYLNSLCGASMCSESSWTDDNTV
eukprot:TRINITY_DN4455_c0_g1_i1.p1 TRINITY_DN4455_c0_g1~~TRINITY_DN4455_c0_g1_i1.p1  ORF type:complete len:346 (-),score=54.09 TRINITY_DN4455_c0_g1_i1:137-1174(-)